MTDSASETEQPYIPTATELDEWERARRRDVEARQLWTWADMDKVLDLIRRLQAECQQWQESAGQMMVRAEGLEDANEKAQAEVEQLRADRDRYRELLEAAEEARINAFAGPATKVR